MEWALSQADEGFFEERDCGEEVGLLIVDVCLDIILYSANKKDQSPTKRREQ
jgi:hypothetical protein